MRVERKIFFVTLVMLCIVTAGCNNPPNKQSGQTEGIHSMEPTICEREAFTVMGTSTRMSTNEESGDKYAKIWSEFERYNEQLKKISTNQKYYGLSFITKQQDLMDYITGMAVPDGTAPTSEALVVRTIPTAQYAVFKCPIEKIGQTYRYIFGKWLPNSPYKPNPIAPSFEEYPPEGQEKLPVCIHIPVTKKTE
jgi:predicted transcriptional regulator YdeE